MTKQCVKVSTTRRMNDERRIIVCDFLSNEYTIYVDLEIIKGNSTICVHRPRRREFPDRTFTLWNQNLLNRVMSFTQWLKTKIMFKIKFKMAIFSKKYLSFLALKVTLIKLICKRKELFYMNKQSHCFVVVTNVQSKWNIRLFLLGMMFHSDDKWPIYFVAISLYPEYNFTEYSQKMLSYFDRKSAIKNI